MADEKAFCPGCPRRGVFMALGKLKLSTTGDTVCSLMGARPPRPKPRPHGAPPPGAGPHGASRPPFETPSLKVSVFEERNLTKSGVALLEEMARAGDGSLSIILDNGLRDVGVEGEALDVVALCRGLGIDRVRSVDPFGISEIADALHEAAETDGVSVMIVEAPCTIRFEIKNPAYWVDPDKCDGCEHCLKVECSAMKVTARSDGSSQVEIDPAECAGCGICVQLCKHDAIFASTQNA